MFVMYVFLEKEWSSWLVFSTINILLCYPSDKEKQIKELQNLQKNVILEIP